MTISQVDSTESVWLCGFVSILWPIMHSQWRLKRVRSLRSSSLSSARPLYHKDKKVLIIMKRRPSLGWKKHHSMNVRVFDQDTFSRGPARSKSAPQYEWGCSLIFQQRKIELNVWHWITWRWHIAVSSFTHTDLFSITYIRCFLLCRFPPRCLPQSSSTS